MSTLVSGLPAGPRLPRIVQTALFMRSRHRFAPRWHAKYGPVFTLRLALGRTVVVLTRPEDIRAVFAGPADVFHAGEGNSILAPVMGENSLLILDEDAHMRSRKRLMPAFNGAALRGYADMMRDLAADAAERLPVGRPFPIHGPMNAVTMEIILRVVFGMSDGDRLAALRPRIGKVTDVGPIQIFGWTYPWLQRIPPWKTMQHHLAATDELLHAEIAERRGQTLTNRDDVLSRLLAADPETPSRQLRDDMITLLLAGHETTATALAWAFHELARNPKAQSAAHHAADSGDDEYLQAVTKEAMRLRPVIYSVARKLTEPTEVAGMLLPKGTIVTPSIGLVQSDAAHFDEPREFRPERFIGSSPETGTWIPFGGGVRRCIGAGFSLQEAAAVLREVLQRYTITADGPPEDARSRNITLVPERGARVLLTRR